MFACAAGGSKLSKLQGKAEKVRNEGGEGERGSWRLNRRARALNVDSVLFAPRGFHFTHEVKEKVSELGVGESAELIFKDINLLSPYRREGYKGE